MASKLDELKDMMSKLGLPEIQERDEYVTAPEITQPTVEDEEMANKNLVESEPTLDEPSEAANSILERSNAPKDNKEIPSPSVGLGDLRKFENQQIQDTQDQISKEEENIKNQDEALQRAERTDEFAKLFNRLDKAAALYGSANPAFQIAGGKPVESINLDTGAEETLRKNRQTESEQKLNELKALLNQQYKEGLLAQSEKQTQVREKNLDLQRQLKKEAEERREAKDQLRRKKTYLDSARGLIKDDPRFKDAVKQGMEFESVDKLLGKANEGNQAALAALGTKLARAMGEVGVLTDTDVRRYVEGTSWGRKLEDWFKKGAKGEISEDTLNDIKENLGMLKEKLAGDTSEVFSNVAGRMQAAYPELENKQIAGILGVPMGNSNLKTDKTQEKNTKKTVDAPYGETVERNGKTYKWNPSVGKYQLAR